MNNYILNLFLKTKLMLLTFVIVCSIFICEKALPGSWCKNCCLVTYRGHHPRNKTMPNAININFKFFEYELPHGVDNAFLENFEVYYSMDNGLNFTLLMSASTENQLSKTWAWIDLSDKSNDTKIDFSLVTIQKPKLQKIEWENGTNPRLDVKNSRSRFNNETWLWMDWHLRNDQNYVTQIRVKAIWHTPGMMQNEFIDRVYLINRNKPNLHSKRLYFSNSSPEQELKTGFINNIVNVYKEANAFIVKGALSENIKVYTTSGKLLNSIVADNDIVKIELTEKQVYIVNIGQAKIYE